MTMMIPPGYDGLKVNGRPIAPGELVDVPARDVDRAIAKGWKIEQDRIELDEEIDHEKPDQEDDIL